MNRQERKTLEKQAQIAKLRAVSAGKRNLPPTPNQPPQTLEGSLDNAITNRNMIVARTEELRKELKANEDEISRLKGVIQGLRLALEIRDEGANQQGIRALPPPLSPQLKAGADASPSEGDSDSEEDSDEGSEGNPENGTPV